MENATGSACEQDIDYYPYGGVQNDYCPNVAQNYKFTGKERDAESRPRRVRRKILRQLNGPVHDPRLGREANERTLRKFRESPKPQPLQLRQQQPDNLGDPDGHSDAGTFLQHAVPLWNTSIRC